MKNTVIPRHVDGLGRVVVPNDFRRELGITTDKDVNVHLSAPNEHGTISMSFDSVQPNAVIQGTLGFLILPQIFRYSYGLNDCTLDMWIGNGEFYLKKSVPQCAISGDVDNLIKYKNTGKYLSAKIIKEMYALLD